MDFNHASIKASARETIREAKPSPVNAGMLYLLLFMAASFLTSRFIGFTDADYQDYYDCYNAADVDGMLEIFNAHIPDTAEVILIAALWVTVLTVSAGLVLFFINTVRRTSPAIGNLADGFAFFFRCIGLSVLRGAVIYLGSFLIIPGVFFFYAYRMALYIMIDHPELNIIACMRESRRMMKGHKMNLFRLDISFIGWWIARLIPLVNYGVRVWTIPYYGLSRVIFYERARTSPGYCGPASKPNRIEDTESDTTGLPPEEK